MPRRLKRGSLASSARSMYDRRRNGRGSQWTKANLGGGHSMQDLQEGCISHCPLLQRPLGCSKSFLPLVWSTSSLVSNAGDASPSPQKVMSQFIALSSGDDRRQQGNIGEKPMTPGGSSGWEGNLIQLTLSPSRQKRISQDGET